MNVQTRHFVHGMVFALGLALMVMGIATGTNGAVVVGLCGAVASLGAWLRWRGA
jgi:hypothetical protein